MKGSFTIIFQVSFDPVAGMHAYSQLMWAMGIAFTRGNTLALFLFVIEFVKPRLYSTFKEHLYSVLCFSFHVQFEVSLVLCENVITGPFYL